LVSPVGMSPGYPEDRLITSARQIAAALKCRSAGTKEFALLSLGRTVRVPQVGAE
jgi:hypothetical protein